MGMLETRAHDVAAACGAGVGRGLGVSGSHGPRALDGSSHLGVRGTHQGPAVPELWGP